MLVARRSSLVARRSSVIALLAALVVLLGATPSRLSAQLFMPAPPGEDTCMMLSRVPAPPHELGDITGDGIPDVAYTVRGIPQSPGFVLVVDGATGAPIQQMSAPPQLDSFGLGVFPTHTSLVSTTYDLAIVSLHPLGNTVVSLYNSQTGLAVATIEFLPTAASTYFSLTAFGDVDGDGIITLDDLAAAIQLWAAATTGPAVAQADFDGDGIVSEGDVWEVASRLGGTVDEIVSGDFVGGLLGTLVVGGPDEDGGTNSGLGCVWCLIWCGAALDKAFNCVANMPCPDALCLAQFPDRTSFEFVECFANARRNGITTCLKDTADAAGDCGKCVYKCGPKP